MNRKPVDYERDYQEFHLVLCRYELFALHQALTVLNPGSPEQQQLRTYLQNLLYPTGAK